MARPACTTNARVVAPAPGMMVAHRALAAVLLAAYVLPASAVEVTSNEKESYGAFVVR